MPNMMLDDIASHLTGASIPAQLVTSSQYNDQNGEAIFQVEGLLLRFIRQRGEDFLGLGFLSTSGTFYQFDDIEIAMGWKSVAQIMAKREPEKLSVVLSRLAVHFKELSDAFSSEHELSTRRQIQLATEERTAAFVRRWSGRKESPN